MMRRSKQKSSSILAAAVMGVGLMTGGTTVFGASDTWKASPTNGNWNDDVNWVGGIVPGEQANVNNAWTVQNADAATFSSSDTTTIQLDHYRVIGWLVFDADAGNYTFNPGPGGVPNYNWLYLVHGITGNSASTLTFNHNVIANSNSTFTPAAGQTFNFKGVYEPNGKTLSIKGNGTINFDGAMNGGSLSLNADAPTVNINGAPSSGLTLNAALTDASAGTLNLNASGIGRSGFLRIDSTGAVNLNAANALTNTAALVIGYSSNTTSGSAVTINHDQDYNGAGGGVGSAYGTLLGLVGAANTIGADGLTTGTGTSSASTLWVNNNPSNGAGHSTSGGSATGESDVNIVTGTLGGNGFIANNGADRGVTLHKRIGSVTSYGRLSPGPAASEIGTLTMSLGDKGLNIKHAVVDANTQTLLFDLDSIANSDKVVLTAGTLFIGEGGLEFDDFVFNPLSGFGPGIYTLFETSDGIDGSLGTSLSGGIGAYTGTLSIGGDDLILTVVPEPSAIGALAIGGLGLLARRRRS